MEAGAQPLLLVTMLLGFAFVGAPNRCLVALVRLGVRLRLCRLTVLIVIAIILFALRVRIRGQSRRLPNSSRGRWAVRQSGRRCLPVVLKCHLR